MTTTHRLGSRQSNGFSLGLIGARKAKQSLESAKPLAHRYIAHRLGIEIDSVEYFSVQPQKVYWLTIFRRGETGGERPHKMKSPQTPFRTT